MKRFKAVSDLPEWTVYDYDTQADIFPTLSGNRAYAFKGCSKEMAELVADALNRYWEGGMKVIVSFSHLITLAKAEATARLAIPYNEEAFLKAQREHDEYVEVCLKADGMMIPQ